MARLKIKEKYAFKSLNKTNTQSCSKGGVGGGVGGKDVPKKESSEKLWREM